ncbi:site-specific integrase [Micromonospora musae]|uniref:site-specific integrase n=1 Tax=Micromonospora musae TaxID=1894970 RepID=UPI0033E4D771
MCRTSAVGSHAGSRPVSPRRPRGCFAGLLAPLAAVGSDETLHHRACLGLGVELPAEHLAGFGVAGYEIVIRVHLVPALGKKQLTKLTPQDIRKLLTAKRQAGLSVRMVQYIHAVLRNALQNAVREELVARNVPMLVQVETPDYEVGQGLAITQAQCLLETVNPTHWHSLYVLALMLGLRRGELLGLRWSDVDLDAATLTVRQNLVRASGELRVQAPKTRRSRRTLPLPPPVVAALRQQRTRQAEERLAAGPSWAGNDLVFSTSLGTPIEPRNLTGHFYRVRDRAGLPGIRFHDLRHTCLALLLSLGTPPHIAQATAGHSHVDVTMMIYAHSGMTEQTEAYGSWARRSI